MDKTFDLTNILSALREGASPDDIASAMAETLNNAMSAYDAEKKAEEEAAAKENIIEEAAINLANAYNNYAAAIGEDSTITAAEAKNIFDAAIAATKFANKFIKMFDLDEDTETCASGDKTDPVNVNKFDKVLAKMEADDAVLKAFLDSIF